MNLHIAQLVALATHFNGRCRHVSDVGLGADHPTCRACASIEFHQPRSAWLGLATRWAPIARDPSQFLAEQARPELSACLVYQPTADTYTERLAATEITGGPWSLLVAGVSSMDRWVAEWKKAGHDAAGDRPWRVRYYRVEESARTEVARYPPIKDLVVALRRVLLDLFYLAQQQNLAEWAERFALAEKCLSSDDPLALAGRRDLAPANVLYRPAERLLACAHAAWVFSGPESWNRLMLPGPALIKHQQWTNQLYNLLNRSICAAINSSAGNVV